MMKKLFLSLLLICFLAIPGSAMSPAFLQMVSGGVDCTCSGDWSDGGTERFQKTSTTFCTTDWSQTDISGVLDMYDSAQSRTCGQSASVIYDSDNAEANRIVADYGSNITSLYIAGWIYIPAVADGKVITSYIRIADSSNDSVIPLQLTGTATNPQLQMTGDDNYFTVTAGIWYELGLHSQKNDTCTLRIYNSAGNVVNHDGAAQDATKAGADKFIRVLRITDNYDDAAAITGYFDNFRQSTVGWVRAQ